MLSLLLAKEGKRRNKIPLCLQNHTERQTLDTENALCHQPRPSGTSKAILIWKVPVLSIPDINPRVFYQHGPV